MNNKKGGKVPNGKYETITNMFSKGAKALVDPNSSVTSKTTNEINNNITNSVKKEAKPKSKAELSKEQKLKKRKLADEAEDLSYLSEPEEGINISKNKKKTVATTNSGRKPRGSSIKKKIIKDEDDDEDFEEDMDKMKID